MNKNPGRVPENPRARRGVSQGANGKSAFARPLAVTFSWRRVRKERKRAQFPSTQTREGGRTWATVVCFSERPGKGFLYAGLIPLGTSTLLMRVRDHGMKMEIDLVLPGTDPHDDVQYPGWNVSEWVVLKA